MYRFRHLKTMDQSSFIYQLTDHCNGISLYSIHLSYACSIYIEVGNIMVFADVLIQWNVIYYLNSSLIIDTVLVYFSWDKLSKILRNYLFIRDNYSYYFCFSWDKMFKILLNHLFIRDNCSYYFCCSIELIKWYSNTQIANQAYSNIP